MVTDRNQRETTSFLQAGGEKTMRRRNVFFLSILLAAVSAVLILPTTGWLARLELKGAVGIANPAMTNSDALSKRSQAIAAANPDDFDLAYAAALRQVSPSPPGLNS